MCECIGMLAVARLLSGWRRQRYDDGCGSQSQGYRHTPGMKANRVASRGLRMLRGWLTSVSVRYLRYSWELMSTETIYTANYVM